MYANVSALEFRETGVRSRNTPPFSRICNAQSASAVVFLFIETKNPVINPQSTLENAVAAFRD